MFYFESMLFVTKNSFVSYPVQIITLCRGREIIFEYFVNYAILSALLFLCLKVVLTKLYFRPNFNQWSAICFLNLRISSLPQLPYWSSLFLLIMMLYLLTFSFHRYNMMMYITKCVKFLCNKMLNMSNFFMH